MVVKQRSTSTSYIDTHYHEKISLPYGDGKLNRSVSAGSMSSESQRSLSQTSLLEGNKLLKQKSSPRLLVAVHMLFIIALCYGLYYVHNEVSTRNIELTTIRRNYDDIENLLLENEAKVNSAHISISNLQSRLMNLLPEGQQYEVPSGVEFNDDALCKKITNRQVALHNRIVALQVIVATLNRGEAIEHFGNVPYKVQFNIRKDDEIVSFIVEMAPLDLMPHSVNYFMETVKAKVWDNSIFSHNSNHIVLAELEDSEGNDKQDIFAKNDISTLSFPEYNSDYPHHKYTLGFGGRPGGPGFYINTEDNRVIHGPGGQKGYDLFEEADPCFAKVIEGHHVIDWMQQKNQKDQKHKLSNTNKQFTVIESIRIISD